MSSLITFFFTRGGEGRGGGGEENTMALQAVIRPYVTLGHKQKRAVTGNSANMLTLD